MAVTLVIVTAQYPDGEEVKIRLVVEDELRASFMDQVIREGMSTLGFAGAVQVLTGHTIAGKVVIPSGSRTPYLLPPLPPSPTSWPPQRRSWWRRLVSGR